MDQQLRDDIRFINKFLYSIQDHRIQLGNWISSREKIGIPPSKRAMKLFENLTEQEKAAKRMARDIVSLTAIWEEFFENISGVGECLSTSLIAEIGDISRFDTISCLWAYAALIAEYVKAKCSKGHKLIMSSDKHKKCPIFGNKDNEPCGGKIDIIERVKGEAPKRIKGYHYLFNIRLKTISHQVAKQLVKQGDKVFRDIYDKSKTIYRNKAISEGKEIISSELLRTKKDKEKYMTLGHIDNRALRYLSKMFLSYLWEAWRQCEGLDTGKG